MQLPEQDRIMIGNLRDAQVLQDIDAHRIDHSKGVIMVTCADGDQMPDIFARHSQICLEHRDEPRIHTLSLNGGALLLEETSPLCQPLREDLVFLHHIETARQLKQIDTVALYIHFPCGAGKLAGLDVHQALAMLMNAKRRLKSVLQDMKVACFCHVDKGEQNKRTYHVSRQAWDEWVERRRANGEQATSGF